ncbi:hypothetical protein AB8P51_01480 [Muriicola sp. SD30]|uniref:hypothetical protein n=1 Tax=Muriicola sp. SD30 TaxID=3240936 RepID=UPI00350ECB93
MTNLLPDRKQNIYPRNKENIRAILNYYFDIPDGQIEWLFEDEWLSINQIEYIAEQVSIHYDFLESVIGNRVGITISNFMHYGKDALEGREEAMTGKGNAPRKKITKNLRERIINSNLKT